MNIKKRKPFTPGQILNKEFMEPYGLTQSELAKKLGVPRRRINEIFKAKRIITSDTACRLGKLFRNSPEYWLNLQIKLDLWQMLHDKAKKKSLMKINPLNLIRKSDTSD